MRKATLSNFRSRMRLDALRNEAFREAKHSTLQQARAWFYLDGMANTNFSKEGAVRKQ
jgi:hypothetical protein